MLVFGMSGSRNPSNQPTEQMNLTQTLCNKETTVGEIAGIETEIMEIKTNNKMFVTLVIKKVSLVQPVTLRCAGTRSSYASLTRACLFAVPICVLCTFVANLRLVRVSLRWPFRGLTITNISVLEFPPSENWSR